MAGRLETSTQDYPNPVAFKMASVYEGEESDEENVLDELLQPENGETKNRNDNSYNEWTILQLKAELNRRNLSKTGRKQRLQLSGFYLILKTVGLQPRKDYSVVKFYIRKKVSRT